MWQPGWEGIWGRGFAGEWIYIYIYIYVCVCVCVCIYICIYMAESLHCSSETIKTLVIGYIPIQNKKFKKLLTPLINNKLIDTVFIY